MKSKNSIPLNFETCRDESHIKNLRQTTVNALTGYKTHKLQHAGLQKLIKYTV